MRDKSRVISHLSPSTPLNRQKWQAHCEASWKFCTVYRLQFYIQYDNTSPVFTGYLQEHVQISLHSQLHVTLSVRQYHSRMRMLLGLLSLSFATKTDPGITWRVKSTSRGMEPMQCGRATGGTTKEAFLHRRHARPALEETRYVETHVQFVGIQTLLSIIRTWNCCSSS